MEGLITELMRLLSQKRMVIITTLVTPPALKVALRGHGAGGNQESSLDDSQEQAEYDSAK